MTEDTKLKISLIQISRSPGSVGENRRRIEYMIFKALRQRKRPDILVLPEMWSPRFSRDGTDVIGRLQEIAKKSGVHIVGGSVADRRSSEDNSKGAFYNTAYIINRRGEIAAQYDQVHLPKGNSRFSSGDEGVTFKLDDIPCGIIIGNDLRFPEFIRRITLQGAKLIFIPGMWPSPLKMHWKLLNIVRAIENQVFIVAVNSTGKIRNTPYPGMSMVVNPWGRMQLEGDEIPGVLTTIINLSLVDHIRKEHPILGDRRPELY